MSGKTIKHVTIALLLCSIFVLSGCNRGSPLVVGEWDDDTFTNVWTNITFNLPVGLQVLPMGGYAAPGQRNDLH